jgi:hypothetical protein
LGSYWDIAESKQCQFEAASTKVNYMTKGILAVWPEDKNLPKIGIITVRFDFVKSILPAVSAGQEVFSKDYLV